MRAVTRFADVIMSTGHEVARVHPGALSFGDRLVPYLPPVDVSEFAPDPERSAAARSELGLGPSDLVVGTVSNLSPMKGHLTFIRAAAHLRRRRPNVRFVLLGATLQPDYTRMLLDEAESLGLRVGSDLLVVDPGSRVSQLAPALDLFWLTSEPRSEGIPTTVEEAMALGIPVVAANVGGVREIVERRRDRLARSAARPGGSSSPPQSRSSTIPRCAGGSARLPVSARWQSSISIAVQIRT